jgi:hypothetical protein
VRASLSSGNSLVTFDTDLMHSWIKAARSGFRG